MILRFASWLLAAALLAMAPTVATYAAMGCILPNDRSAAMHEDCDEASANPVCADSCAAICHGVLANSAGVPLTFAYGMPPPVTNRVSAMRALAGPEPPPPRSLR